ncbi:MAG: hypothetical protein AB1403_01135 [Candidatus Riflebacteria bacterium]
MKEPFSKAENKPGGFSVSLAFFSKLAFFSLAFLAFLFSLRLFIGDGNHVKPGIEIAKQIFSPGKSIDLRNGSGVIQLAHGGKIVVSGTLKFLFDQHQIQVTSGEATLDFLSIPSAYLIKLNHAEFKVTGTVVKITVSDHYDLIKVVKGRILWGKKGSGKLLPLSENEEIKVFKKTMLQPDSASDSSEVVKDPDFPMNNH